MMNTQNNGITELVFILDKSGSMYGLESDTVGGFNATLAEQKKQSGKTYVSTVLFSDESKVVHDRADIETITPMTESDYTVGGCTALLDALGGAIHHIMNIHKYARPEDVPEHTIFAITTDGMENASRRYTADQIRQMIETQKQQHGWEFLFLAANIDAVQTACQYGISKEFAENFEATSVGVDKMYKNLNLSVNRLRENRKNR